MQQNLTIFQRLFSIKILTKLSYWVYTRYVYFWMKFFNFTQMPKKPFSLRSVPGTHIKYAKKMKKFDRAPDPKSRKSVFSVTIVYLV
jgi:hypothetical protein